MSIGNQRLPLFPCLNGGFCNNFVNSFTCTCVAGYSGVVFKHSLTNVSACHVKTARLVSMSRTDSHVRVYRAIPARYVRRTLTNVQVNHACSRAPASTG